MYARKRLLLLCVLCGGLRSVPWTDLMIEAIHMYKYMRRNGELHSEGVRGDCGFAFWSRECEKEVGL